MAISISELVICFSPIQAGVFNWFIIPKDIILTMMIIRTMSLFMTNGRIETLLLNGGKKLCFLCNLFGVRYLIKLFLNSIDRAYLQGYKKSC